MRSKDCGNWSGALAASAILVMLSAIGRNLMAQVGSAETLDKAGQVGVDGREVPFLIRRLPVSSFPELPQPIAAALAGRGCLIPQTYEAHRPENVIRGSLERAGSSDWAVLCSVGGRVSLLVFFASGTVAQPTVLAQATEMDRLQPRDASGALGFNWGIDRASPARIHDAQAGMHHRPPLLDHDCVADSTLESKTVYHLYRNGAWEKVDLP